MSDSGAHDTISNRAPLFNSSNRDCFKVQFPNICSLQLSDFELVHNCGFFGDAVWACWCLYITANLYIPCTNEFVHNCEFAPLSAHPCCHWVSWYLYCTVAPDPPESSKPVLIVAFQQEGTVTRHASFLRYPSRSKNTLFLLSAAQSITFIWPHDLPCKSHSSFPWEYYGVSCAGQYILDLLRRIGASGVSYICDHTRRRPYAVPSIFHIFHL
jgi:hypothetical protein